MSKKEKSTIALIIGFSLFMLGWAIRSTFIMHNFVNKPLGGAILTTGMLIMGYAAYKLLNKK
jgi:hypothetical protein